jgi:Ulp1 family protease
VVISVPFKTIITCDSVKNTPLPVELLEDIESMLDHYYPLFKGQWKHDKIRNEEQFQDPHRNKDCGFHILNFAEAALKDTLITINHNAFNMFKERIEKELNRKD